MNILKKISNFKFQISNYWRWHPEVAIRYLPIVEKIKNEKLKMKKNDSFGMDNVKLEILEVGSGWLGIAPYLGERVVGLDEDFEGKKFHLLKQTKGSILDIPFKEKSFDFVICVDVLEHLAKEKRKKALEEILRVAKNEIFIGVPCGQDSYQQDKKLETQYRQIYDQPFPFLQDHLKFGLPAEAEIIRWLNLAAQKNHRKIIVKAQNNENLNLREFLMKGWMTKNIVIDFIYRKLFLLLIPFFGLFDKPPYYRKLFFVKIES